MLASRHDTGTGMEGGGFVEMRGMAGAGAWGAGGGNRFMQCVVKLEQVLGKGGGAGGGMIAGGGGEGVRIGSGGGGGFR